MVVASVLTAIITLGVGTDELGPIRKKIILYMTMFFVSVFMPLLGIFSWTKRRPAGVDYRKWLGPDWKPTYKGASMFVSNHSGFVEIFLPFLFIRPMPGFIAKNSLKQFPSIGPIATAAGSYFLDRTDKESRDAVFKKI